MILIDIPTDSPHPLENDVTTTCFVDSSHGSNLLNRRSQTGIIIFLNRDPIHWYRKSQKTVESFTFGSEFIALKTAVEMIIAFRFKLRCFFAFQLMNLLMLCAIMKRFAIIQ